MNYLESGFNENLIRVSNNRDRGGMIDNVNFQEFIAPGSIPPAEVSGALVLSSLLNTDGDFLRDVITPTLDTKAKEILGEFTFQGSGALAINTDASNGIWISPTGILAKKAGVNTLAIGADGSAVFGGTLSAVSGTFGIITAGVIKANSVWIGEISGHTGISLTGTDYKNIFFRRDSDGVIFFRINEGGATSLTYDSSSGALVITGGTISAGTITGSTVQTATTGYRTRMTSANGLQLMNGATQVGLLKADSASSVILQSADNIYLYSGGNQMAFFTANSLDFPASYYVTWAGQGRIRGNAAYLKIEGSTGGNWDMRLEGNFYPETDNAYSCGASDRRWGTVFAEDMRCDDLLVNVSFSGCGSISGCAYNEVNLLSDEQQEQYRNDTGKDGKKNRKDINYTGFAMGDVLCWGHNGLHRSEFDTAPCVIAVADRRGMPTVLGAEKIKVIGKVARGSFLVTSPQEGFARAWTDKKNEPPRGTIIAVALENKEDNSPSMIKAMIQKI